MDTPGTFRYLFFPPAGYAYFAFRERVGFDPWAEGFERGNGAWAADLAMLAYGQDGETPMGWDGVAGRLTAAGFRSAQPFGNWTGLGTQGFVAVHDRFAALAFRGTEPDDWTDFLVNLSAMPLVEDWASIALAHGGFQDALDSVWQEVEAAIGALPNGLPVVVCGHSLGGALAFLTVSRMGESENAAHLYTFGGPRVGNEALGERVLEVSRGRAYRVVNENDLVPAVPPALLVYRHAPAGMLRLRGDGGWTEETEDGSLGLLDVAGVLRTAAALIAESGDLDTAVPEERLADHSPGRYLRRMAAGL